MSSYLYSSQEQINDRPLTEYTPEDSELVWALVRNTTLKFVLT